MASRFDAVRSWWRNFPLSVACFLSNLSGRLFYRRPRSFGRRVISSVMGWLAPFAMNRVVSYDIYDLDLPPFPFLDATLIDRAGASRSFRFEKAFTQEDLQLGLMVRTQLARDSGLLMSFRDVPCPGIWMQNTLIPIDLVFLDAQKSVVDVFEAATPLCRMFYRPQVDFLYCLELNMGAAKRLGFEVGARLEFDDDRLHQIDEKNDDAT